MRETRKKVLALVIDTKLTNEQIESGGVTIRIDPATPCEETVGSQPARNVRVLDSD